jgi:Toastrack DUF4097
MRTSIIRPSVVLLVGLGALSASSGCTVSAHTQTRYTAQQQVTKTSVGTWNGTQQITVYNQNGDLTIVADPNATTISLVATPFAFADNSDDAQAAIVDVTNTIAINESNGFAVSCSIAVSSHGSAANGTTGCQITVTVPAGSAQTGVNLAGQAHNGQLQAQGTFTAPAGGQVNLYSDNGEVSGVAIVGGARAHSGNGSVSASFTPTEGAVEEASSGNGDVALSLPANFAADQLTMTSGNGTVNITGFSDLTPSSTSRGTAGTGAKSITVTTDNGNVSVSSQ